MEIKLNCVILTFLIAVLSSCGGNSDSGDSLNSDLDIPHHPDTDQNIAMRAVCLGCHQLSVKTLGPSIKDISAKYKGSDINRLVSTVRSGRARDELIWGSEPMPPSYLPKEEIQKVIEWMLIQ